MEAGSPYKELKGKGQSTRFFAILLTSITVLLAIVIGFGVYILLAASNEPAAVVVSEQPNIIEEVVIVEKVKPVVAEVIQEEAPKIIVTETDAQKDLDSSIYEEVQEVIKQEEEEGKQSEFEQFYNPEEMPFLHTLVKFSNDIANQVLGQLAQNEQFTALFGEQPTEGHSRQRRSLSNVGNALLKYISYVSFGSYMFKEVQDITEFAVQGRKLSGDPEAFFLDNGFWHGEEEQPEIVEKIDTDVTSVEESAKPNRPPSAYDDGWTPMVNKVSLRFITDMLTTLLNLMREYLMKDNVMECLWFMFCRDMNHQAKYNDPMGYLARVNSVGLKVLVDKEGREVDTVTSVWQALTKWEPLMCEDMFPKCDGSKALEIVNEVANASRK